MNLLLSDWLSQTSDAVPPLDYCTAEAARFQALSPAQQAAEEAARLAESDHEHAAWITSGEPDWFEARRAKRAADRAAAELEWTALHAWINESDDDPTDEEIAAHESRVADWHRRFDHLWPRDRMQAVRKQFSEEQTQLANLTSSQTEFAEKVKSGQIPGPAGLKDTRMTNGRPALRIKSAAELQQKQFAPIKYLVPGYLAEGCTILAGRPKVGKSWLTLDVALAVAAGGDVLGMKAEQGDALVLGLEDNERRLKNRIGKILGPFVPWPERFHFATEWPRQHEGGLDMIREWIEKVPNPRLVVVDVLAKFRAPQGGGQNSYEADYQAIAGLQALASEKNLAIVIVHHLRKSGSDSGDAFDKVSGTLGLSGAADSVLILDRDGQGTNLYGRGRDIEEIETAVTFDRGRCRWQVLGAAAEVRKSDERKAIIDALQQSVTPMSPNDIALVTGMLPNNVRFLISKMMQAGEIERAGRGQYQIPKIPNQPIINSPPPWNGKVN